MGGGQSSWTSPLATAPHIRWQCSSPRSLVRAGFEWAAGELLDEPPPRGGVARGHQERSRHAP
eukprot:scaffold5422_cov36-Tisochrysis_lutea.AAC.6